jgi:predicted DNA-binding antitoxin AbrB/MazE fold protein
LTRVCGRRYVPSAMLAAEVKLIKTLEATFDGAVFRPDEPVELQPNTRVQIVVTVKPAPELKTKSFLQVARSLRLQDDVAEIPQQDR